MIRTRPYAFLVRAHRTLLWSVLLFLLASQSAWAAISHVGSISVATGSSGSGSLTLAYPAGLAADDVLLAQIAVAGNQTITAPAGWTLINRSNNGSTLTQAVYWKRAGASNPASDTWSFGSSDRAAGTLSAYRDVDPVAPVNVYSVLSNASDTSVTAAPVTPTVSGVRLLGLYATANGNAGFTPPSGMAEQQDDASGAGKNGIAVELADEAYAGGTGATGSRVATASTAADNIAHLIALQPATLANYRMDEAAWSGSAGEAIDSSGRSYHATATNGAITAGTTPALSGSPGTCNYASLDGVNDYVAVPSTFPNLTTDFTLTAWIRTTSNAKSGQRIFIDDQTNTGGYGLSLGDGGSGILRFYARATNPVILDTPSVIQNNTWYFVAATMNATAKTKSMYVYSQTGTQLAFVTQTYTGTWGTDAGAASIGGENNASSESGSGFKFSGNLDEVSVFGGALSPAKLSLVMNQTRPCVTSPTVTPSGFNAFETATAAGSVAGVIKTKVAASAFGLDVVALKSSGAAVETAFTGDVKLELVDASAGVSCSAYALIRNLGTLSFAAANQGRKTQSGISESNAWPNVRVRMTYPTTGVPTVTACSTDNFAIRPASFSSVTVSDASSATSGTARTLYNIADTGGNVHKAGQPFRIAATASNAVGAATPHYAGTPASSLTACVLPTSACTLGTLTSGAWSSASGTVTASNASYSEVGSFTMKLVDSSFAVVDSADGSTAAERNIESAAFNVGRFVPDHFDLTTASTPKFRSFNETPANCPTRPFTYVGQPFGYLTVPQATIAAKNAAGATTLNYSGALWKLLASGVTQTYAVPLPNTLDTGLVGVPAVSGTGSGAGSLTTNAADVIAFVRSMPVVPFVADISLSMSIQDGSENAVSGNGIINTATPALFASMAFDDGNQIRFGRLVLTNALGSELLGLPVPIETQYWNGSGFTRNTADACTQLAATNVALSGWQRNLNACETSVTLSGRFNAGRGNLTLSKPGAGNTGSVDLTLLLGAVGGGTTCVGGAAATAASASQSWLQGRWNGGAYDQNPAARGSFGLFRGSKALIYMREM